MKTKNVKVLLSAAIVLLMVWAFASCSKSNDAAPTITKTVLNDSITAATTLSSATTEGVQDGQYTVGSKVTLGLAITNAQAVASNSASTQTEVNNAVVSLSTALATYRAAKIVPVAVDALVGHWSFDEGTGTTAHDASSNHFDGTFKAGSVKMGTVSPVWTVDRKGAAGKAIQFNKGASVEVPYNTKLNPKNISIAVWERVDTINANNRFIGLQSWLGYKFQLQEDNRPFGTVNSVTTPNGTYDRNAGVAVPVAQWHHLVMTYTSGRFYFYIDGVITPLQNVDVTGDAASISAKPYNLVFGADFPQDKYSSDPNGTNFDVVGNADYHVIPAAWGGHFRGALDEMRIYNIELTATQVKSIYDREK